MRVLKAAGASIALLSLVACGGSSTSESSRVDNPVGAETPGTGEANPGRVVGVNGVEIPTYIDPTSAAFIESDSTHFRNAMLGAWAAVDCNVDDISQTSSKAIYVFTDTEVIESEYIYPSTDCSGIARSEWYPLPIRSWQLGDYRALDDGSMAWELDVSITQRGVYDGRVGDDKGTYSYVNIGFEGDQLEFGDFIEGLKPFRATNRSSRYFAKMDEDKPAINAQALNGVWFSACSGRLESTYEFYPDTLVVTDENWADSGCEGASYASRRTTFTIDYGEEFTSVFGDKLLSVETAATTTARIHKIEHQIWWITTG